MRRWGVVLTHRVSPSHTIGITILDQQYSGSVSTKVVLEKNWEGGVDLRDVLDKAVSVDMLQRD